MKKVILLALFLLLPHTAQAASLYLSPSSITLSPNQTGTFTVYVESSSQAMNAASGSISIDGASVSGINKTGSIINFWAEEPTYFTNTISFEGVVLTPGYTGAAGKVLSFTIKAKTAGTYSARFLSGSVLANDGRGTDITSATRGATIQVSTPTTSEEPAEDTEAKETEGTLGAPNVHSSEFPDQKSWYTATSGTFLWDVPEGVTAVRTLLDQNKNSTPSILLDGRVSSRRVSDIPEGVNYFHVQFKNIAGWGEIAHIRVAVDSTPPTLSALNELTRSDLTDPIIRLRPDAKDEGSGVAGLQVAIEGGTYDSYPLSGGYVDIGPLLPQTRNLSIRAVDKAGNVSAARELVVEVTPIAPPHITFWTERAEQNEPIMVSGIAPTPGTTVHVVLVRKDERIELGNTTVERDGTFSLLVTKELRFGTYQVTAYVEDTRGARSLSETAGNLEIHGKGIAGITLLLAQIIGALVALGAVIAGAVWLFLHLGSHIARKHRELLDEIRETDVLTHRAFSLLRKDLAGYGEYLKKERKKRELSREETDFVEEFEQNLKDSETLIRKEIADVDKTARKKFK